MPNKPGQPPDDPSSAPESGTVRDDTSGNNTARRGDDPGQREPATAPRKNDDPSSAPEER